MLFNVCGYHDNALGILMIDTKEDKSSTRQHQPSPGQGIAAGIHRPAAPSS